MNILFVNNFRGRGGGEEFLRDLLPGLVRKGNAVGLVCRPNTPLAEMFVDPGLAVHPTDRSGTAALNSVAGIARIIRDGAYDIVNIQRGHDILQAWAASQLSGRRPVLVYTPQGAGVQAFTLPARQTGCRRHDLPLYPEKLIAFYPRLEQRISIVYYGIDLDRFSPDAPEQGMVRSRFGLAPDTPLIGTVGDLWKNQREFLDSLVAVRRAYPGACYALVASPSGWNKENACFVGCRRRDEH